MAQDGLSDVGADASASGPFPVGDTGWMAGDFQNGSGLLGLAIALTEQIENYSVLPIAGGSDL